MITADQPTIFVKKGLLAVVTSRQDGNMKFFGSDPVAAKNRQDFFKKQSINENQVAYLYVRDPQAWDIIREIQPTDIVDKNQRHIFAADALVTNTPHIALFLTTADCNPVILYDPQQQAVALIHLGWQSTAVNLAAKVVTFMADRYGCQSKDLKAYFGPAIKPDSYVFEGVITQAADPAWVPFLRKVGKGTGIDLPGYNRQSLLDCGLLSKNIQINQTNTATSLDYFSHYRAARQQKADDEGRFATICMLI